MTLLLVHGLGLNSNIWNSFIPHLKETVFAVGLPGHGRSLDKELGWKQIWKTVTRGLRNEDPNDCTLVLQSFSAALIPEIVESCLKFKKIILLEGIIHANDLGWSKSMEGIEEEALVNEHDKKYVHVE